MLATDKNLLTKLLVVTLLATELRSRLFGSAGLLVDMQLHEATLTDPVAAISMEHD